MQYLTIFSGNTRKWNHMKKKERILSLYTVDGSHKCFWFINIDTFVYFYLNRFITFVHTIACTLCIYIFLCAFFHSFYLVLYFSFSSIGKDKLMCLTWLRIFTLDAGTLDLYVSRHTDETLCRYENDFVTILTQNESLEIQHSNLKHHMLNALLW